MMKEFWNERYKQAAYVYGKMPNVYFSEKLESIKPGSILLPADGEGRNAVHAASLGWEVTAFDISEIGKQKALELAREKQVQIDYQLGTLDSLDLLENTYDVVASIYAHFHPLYDAPIAQYLKPGGYLILEGFAKGQLEYQKKYHSGGPKRADMLYSTELLAHNFKALNILELEEKEVLLKEGAYHEGKALVIRLFAQKQ